MKFNFKEWKSVHASEYKVIVRVLLTIVIIALIAIYLVIPFIQFKNNEKKFLEGAKEYFSVAKVRPNEGEFSTISLDELYKKNYVGSGLLAPGGKTLCSHANSWVRLHNDNGAYKYYVYLDCGIWKSFTDNKGPDITLKGDENVMLYLGSEFNDPGVESVKDNKSGSIPVENVKVDTSFLESNKVGEYEVIYTAKDKIGNEGRAIRKVTVVKSLQELIKANTDDSNIYKGSKGNNFLQFSGMLFRIIKVNSDDTVTIMLADNFATIGWGDGDYNNSNVVKYINDVFLNTIHDKDKYLKMDNKFCIDTITDLNNVTCNTYSDPMAVGLPSIIDIVNSKNEAGNTYFIDNGFILSNKYDDYDVWKYYRSNIVKDTIYSLVGVRPVIVLNKDNLYVNSGEGTQTKPYKMFDYEYGNEGDLLNTRLVGEYIKYSDNSWRIAGFDDAGNTKIVTAGVLETYDLNKRRVPVLSGYTDEAYEKKLDILEEGNLGYKLENEIALNIVNSRLVDEHEYTMCKFTGLGETRYNARECETYTGKISIPNTTDPFSGVNSCEEFKGFQYLLADYDFDSMDRVLVVNTLNGFAFVEDADVYSETGVKVVAYLKNDTKLGVGNGTLATPYEIS